LKQAVGVSDLAQVPVLGSRFRPLNRAEVMSGEVVRRWFVAVVPRDLTATEAVVTFDDPYASRPAGWTQE
jgi:hypothetical protein